MWLDESHDVRDVGHRKVKNSLFSYGFVGDFMFIKYFSIKQWLRLRKQ